MRQLEIEQLLTWLEELWPKVSDLTNAQLEIITEDITKDWVTPELAKKAFKQLYRNNKGAIPNVERLAGILQEHKPKQQTYSQEVGYVFALMTYDGDTDRERAGAWELCVAVPGASDLNFQQSKLLETCYRNNPNSRFETFAGITHKEFNAIKAYFRQFGEMPLNASEAIERLGRSSKQATPSKPQTRTLEEMATDFNY